jgi:hypothetical protein
MLVRGSSVYYMHLIFLLFLKIPLSIFFPYIPPYVPSFVFALQLATCLIHVNPPSIPVSPGCFRKQELLNHSDSLKKWRVGFNGGWGIYVKTIEMFASVAAAVPWVDGSDQYNSVGGGGGELVCCHHIKTSPVSRPAIRKAWLLDQYFRPAGMSSWFEGFMWC